MELEWNGIEEWNGMERKEIIQRKKLLLPAQLRLLTSKVTRALLERRAHSPVRRRNKGIMVRLGWFASLALVVALLVSGGSTASAYDEVAPAWGHTPTVTNLRPQTFDLRLSLDTTGYAYAVVVLTTATAPTAAEVKALTASGGAVPIAHGLVKEGPDTSQPFSPTFCGEHFLLDE